MRRKGQQDTGLMAGIVLPFLFGGGHQGRLGRMVCYLNRGFILEQAIVAAINDYFETINTESLYENFHVKATLDHPFAKIFKNPKGLNAADLFPAVVVSTYEDEKPHDLPMPPQVEGIGLDKEDIGTITNTSETVTVNGRQKERKIPGLCTVVAPEVLKAINQHIDKKKMIFGFLVRTYRRDKISLEIWSENTQLKNEIYEQLRLFVIGNLRHVLAEDKYQSYDIKIDDDTVSGQRSGAWNDQFDVILAGGSITFDVNYAIDQIVLDTNIENPHGDLSVEGGNG
ncbi:MAG: hypothetical protein LBB72_01495 [Spirochaetaceae bacterium]|jgi:hypothetical protein|nr:hypothetical protein [Spirochaetaceae bacterium]